MGVSFKMKYEGRVKKQTTELSSYSIKDVRLKESQFLTVLKQSRGGEGKKFFGYGIQQNLNS